MNKTTNTFEGGLIRAINKTKQPKNSYSYALNTTIVDPILDKGSRANEQGFEDYLTVRSGQYIIMKAQWLGKEQYVFFIKHLEGSGDTFNEIWYVDKEKSIQRLVYSNIGLNFQDDYEISSTYRINYKTERIVYWVDGLNDDRVINVDDVDSSSISIELLSIESSYTKADLEAIVFDTGGSLISGQYFLAASYNLGDSFTTSAFGLTNPISIASKNYFYQELDADSIIPASTNKQFGDTDGDNFNTPTKKSIQVVFSNLDPNFDSINLVVIHTSNNVNTIKVVKKLSTKGLTELIYKYTGNVGTEDTTIDVSDITVDSVKYYASEVIAQKENRLVRGNSKLKGTSINYQQFANDIKVGYTINEELVFQDSIINHKSHDQDITIYDPATELFKQHSASPAYLSKTANSQLDSKTFMRDEVYSLGVGFELNDGTETDIFHIVGRELNTFSSLVGIGEYNRDIATDSATWDDDLIDGDPRWMTMNTAVKRDGEIGDLAYWESDEEYTPDYNFPTGKIRHHKMPSDVLEPIYRTEITGDPNQTDVAIPYKIYKRHLSLHVSNIVIPDEYKEIIKKVKIYYTPRTADNKTILSKGLCYVLDDTEAPMVQPEHLNFDFTESGVATTKLEFVSPEVHFRFKETSLAASRMKICGIDKGYVSYMGGNLPDSTTNIYYNRMYNNELHDEKQREQAYLSSMCFYNQRTIPTIELYSTPVDNSIFLDGNFVGSTIGFDVDYTGGQQTALISLLDPIALIPIVIVDRTLNSRYPELLYPTGATKPSDLFQDLVVPTDIPDFDEFASNLHYDTAYYVSLNNENRSAYGKIESLEYVSSGAHSMYNGEDDLFISVNSGDTFIDVHHFKKTWIKLVEDDFNDKAVNLETTGVGDTVKDVFENAAASYASFFVETDINIRMRREGSQDDQKYFPKSFYSGSKLRDYGRSIDEQEYYEIEPGYEQSYLKLFFANNQTQEDFERTLNNDIRYSTRLIYSDKQDLEDKTDRYRIVRVNNYRDLPLDRGPLSGLFTKHEKLYALTRDSLFDIYASNQTIKSENGDNITVGTGEFFANEPTELIAIEGGFGGTTSKYSICETPYGYLFVDRFKNKCLLFNEKIKDLNILGLDETFSLELFKQIPDLEKDSSFDNPLSNAGIISTYDPFLQRIIVSKKDYKLLNPYKGIFEEDGSYEVDDVILKEGVLQKVDGIVDTTIVNESDFSDWTIDNTNQSVLNMLIIDNPTLGSVISTTTDGINYQATTGGEDSLTVNQSGLSCGSKETVTISNLEPFVPINYTLGEGDTGFIDNNLEFYIGITPVLSEGYYNEGTGVFNNARNGETVTVLQSYYGGETDPDGNVVTVWSDPVVAKLILKVDGVVVYNLVTTFPASQPVGNLHDITFVLDKTKTYEIISTVENPIPVTIDWSVTQDSSPYVNADINLYRNGVFFDKGNPAQLAELVVGDVLTVESLHYAPNFRWPDDATYTITIENAANDVIHTVTGGSRDITIIETYNLPLTEDYYSIVATSQSSDTTLAPLGFDINNSTGLSGGSFLIKAFDDTTLLEMLRVSEDNNLGAYNVKNDAGTQGIQFYNGHAIPITVRLRTTTATFDETFVVAIGETVTKLGLTKAGIIIDLTL